MTDSAEVIEVARASQGDATLNFMAKWGSISLCVFSFQVESISAARTLDAHRDLVGQVLSITPVPTIRRVMNALAHPCVYEVVSF